MVGASVADIRLTVRLREQEIVKGIRIIRQKCLIIIQNCAENIR